MSTLASNPRIKKMIHSISEIWFIIILSFPAWDINSSLITKGWDTSHFIASLLFALLMTLLIKQIFQKTGWISSIIWFFSFVRFPVYDRALLSEYREFPTGQSQMPY